DVPLCASHASNEHFNILKAAVDYNRPVGEGGSMLVELQEKLTNVALEHGLEAPGCTGISEAGLKLVFLPRAFQFAGDTFDESYHFIGPSLGSRATSNTWRPPEEGVPVLLISLGTSSNRRPEFYRLCIEAFRDSAWHVVMAIGGHIDPTKLDPIPDNFEVRSYFPQPVVLRRAAAFVSHTGMNSTMESLYCQVPIVSVPQTAEQALNGDRVQELCLGRRLDPEVLTPQLLRDTVQDVAGSDVIRANLARFNRDMKTGGGVGAGADALESYLSLHERDGKVSWLV
ncbi:MAG: glycosyl transferase, partial [Pseudonocardiales bacterium]|nr:glycosyl transferase [Pseudonocardiales bacterium]